MNFWGSSILNPRKQLKSRTSNIYVKFIFKNHLKIFLLPLFHTDIGNMDAGCIETFLKHFSLPKDSLSGFPSISLKLLSHPSDNIINAIFLESNPFKIAYPRVSHAHVKNTYPMHRDHYRKSGMEISTYNTSLGRILF